MDLPDGTRTVFQVVSAQGVTLAVLTDGSVAEHLALWASGVVVVHKLLDTLEEYVVSRQTTIAEEINLRRALELPCDIDTIIARRTGDRVETPEVKAEEVVPETPEVVPETPEVEAYETPEVEDYNVFDVLGEVGDPPKRAETTLPVLEDLPPIDPVVEEEVHPPARLMDEVQESSFPDVSPREREPRLSRKMRRGRR